MVLQVKRPRAAAIKGSRLKAERSQNNKSRWLSGIVCERLVFTMSDTVTQILSHSQQIIAQGCFESTNTATEKRVLIVASNEKNPSEEKLIPVLYIHIYTGIYIKTLNSFPLFWAHHGIIFQLIKSNQSFVFVVGLDKPLGMIASLVR